jgi:hypothetical protein
MIEAILSFVLVEHQSHGTLGEPERGLDYAHSDAQWAICSTPCAFPA